MSQFHTEHFNIHDIFHNCSSDEILNALDDSTIYYNIQFALHHLDLLRTFVDIPFLVTSWYRDEIHNTRVGGVPNSQHIEGLAIDFRVKRHYFLITCVEEILRRPELSRLFCIDQFIIYDTFFHISFSQEPRHQIIDKRKSKKRS